MVWNAKRKNVCVWGVKRGVRRGMCGSAGWVPCLVWDLVCVTEQEEGKRRRGRKKKNLPKPVSLTSKSGQWLLSRAGQPSVWCVTSHTGPLLVEISKRKLDIGCKDATR